MNHEEKLGVKQALRALKSGYLLRSVVKGEEILFAYRNDEILVDMPGSRLSINPSLFLEIYAESSFEIVDDINEEAVDPKRDEEYYSWKQ